MISIATPLHDRLPTRVANALCATLGVLASITPSPAVTASPGDFDLPANEWTLIAPAPPVHHGIMAFSGAVYDSERKQFLIFGGGHNDYWGNEVWAFDLESRIWKEMYKPDAKSRYTLDNLDIARGKLKDSDMPFTRHTYQQLAYVPSLDGMVVWSGCGPGWGELGTSKVPGDTWIYRPGGNTWELLSTEAPATMGGAMCFDPKRNTLWGVGGTGGLNRWLYRFDLAKNSWSQRRIEGMEKRSWHNTLLCEPKRDLLLMTAGTTGDTWLIDPVTARAEPINSDFRPDAKGGLAYHEQLDVAVFVGREQWAMFDFDRRRWTMLPVDAVPEVGSRGVFGRLRYLTDYKIFLLAVKSGTYAMRFEMPPALEAP